MRQQVLALGLGIGLLALLWVALRTPLLERHQTAQPSEAIALVAPLASQQQVSPTAAIALVATVGTDECPNESPSLTVRSGTTVYYCYLVENTGDITLTNHSLSDDQFGQIFANRSYTLSPNAQYIITDTLSRVIDASVTNNAIWTAQESSGAFAPTSAAATTVSVDNTAEPGLAIKLTVGLNEQACATDQNILVPTGSTVYYCLTVQNTGGITLTSHNFSAVTPQINDNLPNWMVPPGTTQVITYGTLERLLLRPFLRQASVAQTINTTLALRSTAENGETVTASSNAVVRVGRVAIVVRKTVSTSPTGCSNSSLLTVAPNQSFYYCLVVRNTGEIPLTRHTFSEAGSPNIVGEFSYTLAPGQSMPTLTHASITSTPGLTFTQPPSLGPVAQTITAVKTLAYTASNDENFLATAAPTTTINVSLAPFEVVLSGYNNPNPCTVPGSVTANIGNIIWYCVSIKNNSGVQLTHHEFTQYISPPGRLDSRYGYTATTSFTHTINPAATLFITNAFFTRTVSPPLRPVMGPYTVTAPLSDTTKMTNTVYVTSTNRTTGFRLTGRSSFTLNVNRFTPTPTPTWTFTPGPTNTPTPTPSNTPFGGPPTNTPPPTPTVIGLSLLPQPTSTPNVFVSSNVSTPAAQFQSPLGQPTPTPTTFVSQLPTPTITPAPAVLAAAQTAEAAITATALATAFTATPTVTDTPTPTDTATPTGTPTHTVTPTATQRVIEQPTATLETDSITLFTQVVDASLAAAGWLWFIMGSLVFFVTAGVVAGLAFRRQERQRYHLAPSSQAEPGGQPASPPLQPRRPARSVDDDMDDWPTSLP